MFTSGKIHHDPKPYVLIEVPGGQGRRVAEPPEGTLAEVFLDPRARFDRLERRIIMAKPTLLDPEFLAELPSNSEQLDVLDVATLNNWVEAMAAEGGYDPELEVAVEKVAGTIVAEQYHRCWSGTVATFGDRLDEDSLRVANLSRALAVLAQQIAENTPQRPAFTGAQLMAPDARTAAAERIGEHSEQLIKLLVREGLTAAEAEALVNSSAMLSAATLERLIDANQSTLAMWRKAGTGPPFVKNPGRAGLVRYPVKSLIPWLLAGETILVD